MEKLDFSEKSEFSHTLNTNTWYNLLMNENQPILRVIEREEIELAQEVKPQISLPNQTNPIYKKLVKFCNEKIGEKFSLRDLLR